MYLIVFLIANSIFVIGIDGKAVLTKIKELKNNTKELIEKTKNLKISDIKRLLKLVLELQDFILRLLTNPIIMSILIIVISIGYAFYIVIRYEYNWSFGRAVGVNFSFILLVIYFVFYNTWKIVDTARETFADVGNTWLYLYLLSFFNTFVVYEYCLSRINIVELALSSGTIIVNLHNWNGEGCISREAYSVAERMGIKLLTMERFYPFIRSLRVR